MQVSTRFATLNETGEKGWSCWSAAFIAVLPAKVLSAGHRSTLHCSENLAWESFFGK